MHGLISIRERTLVVPLLILAIEMGYTEHIVTPTNDHLPNASILQAKVS